MKIYANLGEGKGKFWIFGLASEEADLWEIMFLIKMCAVALKGGYLDDRLNFYYDIPTEEVKVWLETLFGKNVFTFISQKESSKFDVDWEVPACNFLMDSEEFEQTTDFSEIGILGCLEEYIQYRDLTDGNWDKSDYVAAENKLKMSSARYFPIRTSVAGRKFWRNLHNFLLTKNTSHSDIKKIISALKNVLRWSQLYRAELAEDMEDYKVKKMKTSPKQ